MSIIASVRTALKRVGADANEISEFTNEAMSGDYENVLATAAKWVHVS